VTENAPPGDWSDATARTYADQIRLARHGAVVERVDPRRRNLPHGAEFQGAYLTGDSVPLVRPRGPRFVHGWKD
jgi:hypothetical protein